jgi:hypothetical protein
MFDTRKTKIKQPHHSYMVASVTQSLIWLYPFRSVLTQPLSYQVYHSPLCRITEFQVLPFPALLDYGISSVSILRFVGLRNFKCFNSPLCRITEFQVFQFPALLDYGMSSVLIPRFVGLRNIKNFIPRSIGLRNVKCVIPWFIGLRNIKSLIPRFIGLRNIKTFFTGLSDYGISKSHSPVYRITEYQKCLSPFCRITEG